MSIEEDTKSAVRDKLSKLPIDEKNFSCFIRKAEGN